MYPTVATIKMTEFLSDKLEFSKIKPILSEPSVNEYELCDGFIDSTKY